MRVNLLLAGAAVAMLLVGFGLGAAVGGSDRPAPATGPPASTAVAATVTSIVVQPAPLPRSCATAVESADRAITFLVGKVRDERLTRALQAYTRSKRACQRGVR